MNTLFTFISRSFVNLLNTSTVPNLQHSSSLMIDVSLTKLFQCMSIAYRQKLTSPKWNRFLGMKLRWKDKFRLNNVIWRCWHMQFIKGHRKLVCAFANPMELDNHNKTEAGAILEGKYWKRKMNCILSEYQKWRIFYKNQHSWPSRDSNFIADVSNSLESVIRTGKDDIELESLITDHDFFVDALFNSLGSQSVHFQDAERMISNSDFIQPSLNPLQPNLEDLMDLDPMAPLQDWLSSKLPENVEESTPSLPLQNIKDIEVAGTRYHPFSHASLRDVDGFSKPLPVTTVTSNISNTNYIASGDSQPSTSTFSHHHPHSSYSEYNNKKKAPLPGKKLWAIQQCQQQQQQHHQQQSWEQDKSYSEAVSNPLVSSPHVSVIQMSQQHVYPSNTSESTTRTNNISQQHVYPSESSESTTRVNNTNQPHVYPGDTSQQHVYSGDTSVRPGLAPPQQRSVIATNPASQQQHQPCKPPAPTYEATYTPSYLTPRAQSYVGAGAGLEPVPVVKNESPELQTPTAQSSELVQLLKSNQQKSKSEPTYRNTRGPGRPSRKHKNAESAEDLSNISGKLKKVVSIPPPPANGLPQPSFTLGNSSQVELKHSLSFIISGSSNSSLLDDTKISSAEQKRRCTIKNGFEYLRTLIPSLSQTPNVKISKAALLAKGAEHVQLLGAENETLGREVEQLRKSVDNLSADITHYQLQLPAAGSLILILPRDRHNEILLQVLRREERVLNQIDCSICLTNTWLHAQCRTGNISCFQN